MSLRITIFIFLIPFCISCGCNENPTFTSSENISQAELVEKNYESNNEFIIQKNHEDEIITFFKSKDFNQMNSFIDKEMKLTILFSIGVNPYYVKIDSLSENYQYYLDNNIPFWIAEDILLNLQNVYLDTLIYSNEPIFECEKILQQGAFIDRSENIKIMTQSIEKLIYVEEIENENAKYLLKLENEYSFYNDIESKSIRVVITKKSDAPNQSKIMIFHFTEKNGRLYLTLIDFESFNCSV